MEQFFYVFVKRMLEPLFTPVQQHKVTAFVWTNAHWEEVAQKANAAARSRYAVVQQVKVEQQRQAAVAASLVKQQDDAAIGTFEL